MPTLGNLVYEKSTGTGTGPLALTAVTGFRRFSAAFPDSADDALFYYEVRHKTLNEYEIGLGYEDGGLLVRDADNVIESSNSNGLVSFSAGNKDVINDIPASLQEQLVSLSANLAAKVPAALSIQEYTADHTFVLGDATKVIEGNAASTMTLTVPPNTDVAFPIGTQLVITQMGAGLVQLAAGSGVTIRTPETLKLAKRYATMTVIKHAVNTWVVSGYLEAAP